MSYHIVFVRANFKYIHSIKLYRVFCLCTCELRCDTHNREFIFIMHIVTIASCVYIRKHRMISHQQDTLHNGGVRCIYNITAFDPHIEYKQVIISFRLFSTIIQYF